MIHNVSTTAALTAALTTAQAGDTIRLAGGSYGTYTIRDKLFASTVRIESADPADPARFAGLTIRGSSNITLAGLDLGRALDPDERSFTSLNSILSSENITLQNVHVHGSLDNNPQNDGRGLLVQNTRGLLVEDSRFSELHRGMVIETSYNVVLRDSVWETIRSDGVNLAAVEGVVISDNHFSDFRPIFPDHGDAIQFFNTGQTRGSKNITIQNNEILITNYDGTESTGTQGIFISDPLTFGYDNILIRNNVIFSNGAFHGINAEGVRQLQIVDNTVLSKRGDSKDFWIRVGTSDGVVLDGNISDNVILNKVTRLFQGDNINLKVAPWNVASIPNINNPQDASDLIMPGFGYQAPIAPLAAPVSNALASAMEGTMGSKQVQQALTPQRILDDVDAQPTMAQIFSAAPVAEPAQAMFEPMMSSPAFAFGERALGGALIYSDFHMV